MRTKTAHKRMNKKQELSKTTQKYLNLINYGFYTVEKFYNIKYHNTNIYKQHKKKQ